MRKRNILEFSSQDPATKEDNGKNGSIDNGKGDEPAENNGAEANEAEEEAPAADMEEDKEDKEDSEETEDTEKPKADESTGEIAFKNPNKYY